MTKGKKHGVQMILTLTTLLCGLVMQAEGAKIIMPDGPYTVGVKITQVNHQDREIPIIIWYPAAPQDSGEPFKYNTGIRGAAILDAQLDREKGPYPLLLFSHGATACGCQSVYYTENLASFGYIVVAPDHDDSMACHIEGPPELSTWRAAWAYIKSFGNLSGLVTAIFGDYLKEINYDLSYRPKEASAVIDQVLDWHRDQTSFLSDMIAADKIGVTGHSLGGLTALMLGGLPFSCNGALPDPSECYVDKIELGRQMNLCCIDFVREAKGPIQFRDERVKAILPMAPPLIFSNLEQAAAELTLPVMIISGDSRKMEVPWLPIWRFYENAPVPKYAIRLKKTDHLTIADFARTIPTARIMMPGFRFNFKSKAQAYKAYAVAFFDYYLKEDQTMAAPLQEPLNRFVELWSEVPQQAGQISAR